MGLRATTLFTTTGGTPTRACPPRTRATDALRWTGRERRRACIHGDSFYVFAFGCMRGPPRTPDFGLECAFFTCCGLVRCPQRVQARMAPQGAAGALRGTRCAQQRVVRLLPGADAAPGGRRARAPPASCARAPQPASPPPSYNSPPVWRLAIATARVEGGGPHSTAIESPVWKGNRFIDLAQGISIFSSRSRGSESLIQGAFMEHSAPNSSSDSEPPPSPVTGSLDSPSRPRERRDRGNRDRRDGTRPQARAVCEFAASFLPAEHLASSWRARAPRALSPSSAAARGRRSAAGGRRPPAAAGAAAAARRRRLARHHAAHRVPHRPAARA
jgi:hypothetical protein